MVSENKDKGGGKDVPSSDYIGHEFSKISSVSHKDSSL